MDTITIKSFEALLKYNGAGYLYGLTGTDNLGSGVLLFQRTHPILDY